MPMARRNMRKEKSWRAYSQMKNTKNTRFVLSNIANENYFWLHHRQFYTFLPLIIVQEYMGYRTVTTSQMESLQETGIQRASEEEREEGSQIQTVLPQRANTLQMNGSNVPSMQHLLQLLQTGLTTKQNDATNNMVMQKLMPLLQMVVHTTTTTTTNAITTTTNATTTKSIDNTINPATTTPTQQQQTLMHGIQQEQHCMLQIPKPVTHQRELTTSNTKNAPLQQQQQLV
jgi:hypothetical protein